MYVLMFNFLISLMVSEYEQAQAKKVVTRTRIHCYFNMHATQIMQVINMLLKHNRTAKVFVVSYKWVQKQKEETLGLIN